MTNYFSLKTLALVILAVCDVESFTTFGVTTKKGSTTLRSTTLGAPTKLIPPIDINVDTTPALFEEFVQKTYGYVCCLRITPGFLFCSIVERCIRSYPVE